MIVTELYNGQGLGNQLWCYAVTRTISLDLGFDFGIMSPHKFKGSEFMDIDFGNPVMGGDGLEGGPPTSLPDSIVNYYREKKVNHPKHGYDISPLDVNLINVSDNTKIDGEMQAEDYIYHRKGEIIDWLKVEGKKTDNLCVIHFRGGDFVGAGTTLLPIEYYMNAINKMKEFHGNIDFAIVTDDSILANKYFPEIEIIGSSITNQQDSKKAPHHIGGPVEIDYSILNNAEYLILSNSSFGWWAAWTNTHVKEVIAPKYWARYNISEGHWSSGDSLTRDWIWLDRNGDCFDYNQCLE